MTTSKRLETVRGYWGAGEAGNWDGAAQFIGPGYYFIDRATGVESRTIEELLEGRADEEAWSDSRFEIGEVYDTAGDAMIVEAVKSGTITGPWRSMSTEGQRVTFPICTIFRFNDDDLIVGEEAYYDMASIQRQLGYEVSSA